MTDFILGSQIMMHSNLAHRCQNQPELLLAEIPAPLVVKDIMSLYSDYPYLLSLKRFIESNFFYDILKALCY